MTSAEAMKQLKQLQLKRKQILEEENAVCKFTVATTEDVESVRPEYNFQFTKHMSSNPEPMRKLESQSTHAVSLSPRKIRKQSDW